MQKLAFIFSFLVLASMPSAFAADLTSVFTSEYNQRAALSFDDQASLKNFDIYLVPGILSETFLSEDGRSKITFAGITGDYLGEQEKILSQKYGFAVKRLSSSSRSVDEIRQNIRNALDTSRRANRKALFMTHSLGGLALIEELVLRPQMQDVVGGIIFLQSPFYGTPVADFYFSNPYHFNKFLKPVLPFLNTTDETIRYLGTQSRGSFMASEQNEVTKLIAKIPLFTVGGVANGFRSLFTPAVNLMAYGCMTVAFEKCFSQNLIAGPYNLSDGMVPLESSKLPGADFVVLAGADHGETVVKIPFVTYDRGHMTEVLFKILAAKIK